MASESSRGSGSGNGSGGTGSGSGSGSGGSSGSMGACGAQSWSKFMNLDLLSHPRRTLPETPCFKLKKLKQAIFPTIFK